MNPLLLPPRLVLRAIEMAEPLEGAVDRLGRMVDRLPGPRRSRTA